MFLGGEGITGGPALFRNLGNGKFQDVTQKLGINPAIRATACTTGDYDNDGHPDIGISTASGVLLLHNDKSGRFVDVTEAAKIFSDRTAGSSAVVWAGLTFVDYDHDGDLDLLGIREGWMPFTGEEPHISKTLPPKMWRNNGDGTFTDVTRDLGLESTASSSFGTDFNNDRAVDIAVTSLSSAPTILENPREGKFLARQPWSSPISGPTVALAVLDFNHDGWMDLAFTHMGAPGLTLWRNNHGKTFEPSPPSRNQLGSRLRRRRLRLRQ